MSGKYAIIRFRSFLCLLLVWSLSSCVGDKPDTPQPSGNNSTGRKVFIANEGSLGNGNASFSFYNIETDSVYNDVYEQANQQALGDIFQSIILDSDKIYLAINNSDKIAVINKSDYKLIGNISVQKPRYMLKTNSEKMYVSSIYNPTIYIVNPSNFQVTNTITVDYPNTEGMATFNDKVYVCNWDTACNYIYEIDINTDAITARIPLAGYAAQQILIDKNKQLWVLAGNVYKGKTATLTQINPASKQIVKSFTFPAGADIMKPCWNPTKDTLYFLGVNYDGGTDYNGVYRMSINASAIPEQIFIQAQALQYFWGLAVDSVKNQIYVSDPKGFIQNGNIGIYQTDGTKLSSFNVGIGPGFMLFE